MTLAVRRLLNSPGFTTVAVLTLALGIGLSTGMFACFEVIFMQPSASPDSARLVCIYRTTPQSRTALSSPADTRDYAAAAKSFERVATFNFGSANLAEPGQPAERLATMNASADFFPVFGIRPEIGRTFTAKEDKAGAGAVAVLSDGFWKRHFGGDPGVVGRSIRLDGRPVTIIGVMPPSFDNPLAWGRIELWTPQAYDAGTWAIRDNRWLQIIGRLAPGVPLAQAQAEADAVAARLARDHPRIDAGSGLNLIAWNSLRSGNDLTRRVNGLSLAMAGFVLLIACANLANLQLARVAGRLKECAVRVALGASPWRLVRQLLAESLVLSAAGGALGLLLAVWSVRLIEREIVISGQAGLVKIPINWGVLAFAVAVSAATGILFGAVPALVAARADPGAALKDSARGSTGGPGQHRLRDVLVAGELALSVILVAGAGFFIRGLVQYSRLQTGWKPDGLLTATLVLPFNATYDNDDRCRVFLRKLETSLSELPGAKDACISETLPITGFWLNGRIAVAGRPAPARGREPLVYYAPVSSDYFATVGLRLLRGRLFSDGDRPGSTPVAVIDEAMARKLWPGEDPLGKVFASVDSERAERLEVVGVVNDVHPAVELVQPAETAFQVYRPLLQVPTTTVHWLNVAVRSSAPFGTVAAALRRSVARLDPDEPVSQIDSARGSIRQTILSGFILFAKILGIYAVSGLLLAAVGIYGVVANLVAKRTTEFGIRMALGAQARDVLALVLRKGVLISAAGAAAGLAGAAALLRLLSAMVPGMPGADWATLGITAALLGGTALLACWLPARRATRIDPIIALRAE